MTAPVSLTQMALQIAQRGMEVRQVGTPTSLSMGWFHGSPTTDDYATGNDTATPGLTLGWKLIGLQAGLGSVWSIRLVRSPAL
jgi:hypothetical protein